MKFNPIVLGIVTFALFLSHMAQAAKPSFNCARVSTSAEKAICADDDLAALDRETSRLYKLASTDKSADPAARKNLKAVQRGWIKGRNDCWKESDLNACITASYVMRIYELRADFPATHRNSGASTSTGPFLMHCPGVDDAIPTAFVQVGAGYAYAALPGRKLVLTQVVAASGAHYQHNTGEGLFSLWNKGPDVLLQQPGQPDAQCTIDNSDQGS
ncbi:MliC family protein [Silvimonas amylolytica]|nr:MliC family protein [Silvimonas amylolytica]